MKTIIISPWSKKMRNDKENPKNFPYWEETVSLLKNKGYKIIQVGISGEKIIEGVDDVRINLSLKKLKELLLNSNTFISVDNFFNHFATYNKKKGVVIFGRSDPKIFGYEQNINLLKDRSFLRPNQFELWEQDEFNKDVFVSAEEVVNAVEKCL